MALSQSFEKPKRAQKILIGHSGAQFLREEQAEATTNMEQAGSTSFIVGPAIFPPIGKAR